MKSNIPTAESLDTMSVADLARLPGALLKNIQDELKTQADLLKKRQTVFSAALDSRYGESAKDKLQYQGKESGTVHINDGDMIVDVEAKKSVVWDQNELAMLWQRIAGAEDDPAVYMKRELKVSETALKGWPQNIQDTFAPARTVKSGKPSFLIREMKTSPSAQ